MDSFDIYIDDALVGTLNTYGSGSFSHSSFSYSQQWLRRDDAYAISPDAPLTSRTLEYPSSPGLPGAIDDAGPDSWGRRLIRQSLLTRNTSRSAELSTFDILSSVPDATRMGNLRFCIDDTFVKADERPLPSTADIAELSRNTARVSTLPETVLDAIAYAGSSLGGARPKVTLVDPAFGLSIAKFPTRIDGDDVEGWEAVALTCATECGLNVPRFSHIRLSDYTSALIVERFDRQGQKRVGYISAHTALELGGPETPYSYEFLAHKIDQLSARPRPDKLELFRRVALFILLDNVDDHMRNHGFIRSDAGWELSPLFDVTPDFRAPNIDATPLRRGESGRSRSLSSLEESHEIFGLARAEARSAIGDVIDGCSSVMTIAENLGLPDLDDSMLVDRIRTRLHSGKNP